MRPLTIDGWSLDDTRRPGDVGVITEHEGARVGWLLVHPDDGSEVARLWDPPRLPRPVPGWYARRPRYA